MVPDGVGSKGVWYPTGWVRQIMADNMRRSLRQFQDGASFAGAIEQVPEMLKDLHVVLN